MSLLRRAFSSLRSVPVVGVICDRQLIEDAPYLVCEERYVTALRLHTTAVPLLIPSLEKKTLTPDEILASCDGLIFTGSPSNVNPALYGLSPSETPDSHDPARDAVSLPLLKAALAENTPLLATCRGLQELNVACGGTLHQKVHEVPGYLDHREDPSLPYETMYGPAHIVTLTADGFLASLSDNVNHMTVNSLHGQGIKDLGTGLMAEAVAPDGLIEAVRFADHPFAVATQFHPEWNFEENSFSANLFEAFGKSLRGELDLRSGWHAFFPYRRVSQKVAI